MNSTTPNFSASGGRLIHEILPVGWLQCNCSIIGDPETREAIVLDPGDEVERIAEILMRHKLKVKAIVSTHAHIDHVGGLKKLHDLTGAPVMLHADDLPLYQAMDVQAAWIGMQPPDAAVVDERDVARRCRIGRRRRDVDIPPVVGRKHRQRTGRRSTFHRN